MSDDESRQPTDPQTPVSRRLVLLLAVTCGAAVANLYYAQPLLHTLAQTFSVSQSTAGLLVTASQIGYAIGLAFLVPLGDLLERRRLIVGILLVCGVGQAVAARGAELRRVRACARGRRRQLCGRSDHRADGLVAGRRPRARPRRRNRDERTADRNPRGAHRQRDPRRAARLESGVRDRDRRDGAAGRGAPLGAPAGASDRVASVPLAASIGRSHRRARSRCCASGWCWARP